MVEYLFSQMSRARDGTATDILKTALAELGPGDIPSGVDVNSNIARAQGMGPSDFFRHHQDWR